MYSCIGTIRSRWWSQNQKLSPLTKLCERIFQSQKLSIKILTDDICIPHPHFRYQRCRHFWRYIFVNKRQDKWKVQAPDMKSSEFWQIFCWMLFCEVPLQLVSNRRLATPLTIHGLYSQSGRTSYHKISWCLQAARLYVIMIIPFWNFTGITAALLPRCLSDLRVIGKV